jgi:hypothetical protein
MMAKQETVEEYDYTRYLDKEPTDLQARFGEWLVDKVGVKFGTKKEEAAFLEGVRLATALRMPFQRSPENQEASPMVRANRGTSAKKAAAPKKSTSKAAVAEEVEEDDAPKSTRGKRTVRRTEEPPAKPARRPARRRAAPSTEEGEQEAPF